MKKVFVFLSLIAIFMVALTSTANAKDSPDTEVVYDTSGYDHIFLAECLDLVDDGGVFIACTVDLDPLADETLKESASVEGLGESANLVNDHFALTSFDDEFYIRGKEPIRYTDEEINKENSCHGNSVTHIYSDAEIKVGWC